MQKSLDRRQPSTRSRSWLREIPVQRRYAFAGNGVDDRRATSRDDRSSPGASCEPDLLDLPGQTLLEVENAPGVTTGQDIAAGIPATGGLEVLEEHTPGPVDRGLTDADVHDDVEPSAPEAEPLGGAGEVPQPTDEDRPVAGDLLRGDLPVVSDRAWEWMQPLMPTSTGRRGGRWRDHRQVVEAICWKYRTGTPWRELPAQFGPWQTAFERLTRWRADGTWARLLAQARTDADAAGELDWLVAVDTTAVRVHRHDESGRGVGGTTAIATASSDALEDGAAAPEDSAAA